MHDATACAVPPPDEVRRLPQRVGVAREAAVPAAAEPETVHLVLALRLGVGWAVSARPHIGPCLPLFDSSPSRR